MIVTTLSQLLPWKQQAGYRVAAPDKKFWEWYYSFNKEFTAAKVTKKSSGSQVWFFWNPPYYDIHFELSDTVSTPTKFYDSRLRDFQQSHAGCLYHAIQTNRTALDASDTGTGKTFCALAVVKALKLRPLVVCPKSVRAAWREITAHFGVEPLAITNREQYKLEKTPFCERSKKNFIWKVPDDTIFVFDEVHREAGEESVDTRVSTLNQRMLIAARQSMKPILMLSATAADNPLQMKALGYALGLHTLHDFQGWVKDHGVIRGFVKPWEYKGGQIGMAKIHSEIFPMKGSRMRIADLGDKFPETQITAEAYDIDDDQEINEAYTAAIEAARDKEAAADLPIVLALRARQLSELRKIPLLLDLVNEHTKEGKSVVVFFNFRESLELFKKELNIEHAIEGKTSPTIRDELVKRFQSDQDRVILCNVKAGGESISLHDIHGNHPRVSLICPTYSARELIQVCGRVRRQGGKTKSLQRIVFAANTIEVKACAAVRRKLDNMSALNNGDLSEGLSFTVEDSCITS